MEMWEEMGDVKMGKCGYEEMRNWGVVWVEMEMSTCGTEEMNCEDEEM